MKPPIREATPSGSEAITEVIRSAFPGPEGDDIAQLVLDLLVDPTARPLLSLVAEIDSRIVGHVLFTHVRLSPADRDVTASILAPLAVAQDFQGQGIGGELIEEGWKRATEAGTGLVFVLGHPGYYPRHGFAPAGVRGFEAPYPIPAEHADAWMVRAVSEGVLDRASGQVICADALMDPRHWAE